jgi:hypothetical protein
MAVVEPRPEGFREGYGNVCVGAGASRRVTVESRE